MTDLIQKIMCKLGLAIDIKIGTEYPTIVLCNTYAKPFMLDGVACGSIEGFLQAVKLPDASEQKRICALSGKEAKSATTSAWKKEQVVYWNGVAYQREGKEFQSLLRRAYRQAYAENELFRNALAATKGKKLIHLVGKCDAKETILTRDEMCTILTELRNGTAY